MENDLIRRSDALAAFKESTSAMPEKQGRRRIEEIPAVDAVEVKATGKKVMKGLLIGSFITAATIFGFYAWSLFYPTHWRPLPEPPKEET